MTDIVTTHFDDGLATVTLNRPDKKNALTLEMFEAIAAAGEALKDHAGLRGVILTGAGGDFCSGLDFAAMQAMAGQLDEMKARLHVEVAGKANWFQHPCTVWAALPVPVIAAIEGVCLGGGMQIALGADIRISRPDARLGLLEAKWGMIPDMGLTQSLPKLMAADRAKELIMTARMVTGEEAASLGLVSRTAHDPYAEAHALAGKIATCSPEAVAAAKRLVDQCWALPEGEGLAVEAKLQDPLIGAPNQIEAVMAGLAKRPPNFT